MCIALLFSVLVNEALCLPVELTLSPPVFIGAQTEYPCSSWLWAYTRHRNHCNLENKGRKRPFFPKGFFFS